MSCPDQLVCSTVDLDQLILECKIAEVELGKSLRDELFHGWACDTLAKDKLQEVQTYHRLLDEEYVCIQLGGEPCLTAAELQTLFEKVNRITVSCESITPRPDLETDETYVDGWILQNPYCVAREKWEYLAYDILCNLQLEVQLIDKTVACDLTLDISRKDIVCDIMVAIDICQKNCDLNLEVTRKDCRLCELDFDVLTRDSTCVEGMNLFAEAMGTPFTFEEYYKLIEQNVSAGVILCVYQNGACLSVQEALDQDVTEPQVVLHTTTGQYPINLIRFMDNPNVEALTTYGIDISGSKYAENPEAFIEQLNKEYSGY